MIKREIAKTQSRELGSANPLPQATDRTEYGNVSNLGDLSHGDSVVLDYTETAGRRLILTLVKEEKEPP
jgi:hypothetical protein